MSAPDFHRFVVTVDHLTDGHRVKVDADIPGYGETLADDLDTALRMAIPYMVAVAYDPAAARRALAAHMASTFPEGKS